MLILTRRVGEKVFINDAEIKVTVMGVKGNQVRMGFEAPENIDVHRQEVWESIKNGNKGDEK